MLVPTFCKDTASLTIILWLYFPILIILSIVWESLIRVQMKWCINQLNISYRPTILFLTVLIYYNSWSYSKQTNSQAKKQVYMCLKKYYTYQTCTLYLQKNIWYCRGIRDLAYFLWAVQLYSLNHYLLLFWNKWR